jgi:hypothetical protein
LRGFISDNDWKRTKAISNVIERDYQLKLAMGFHSGHFTRAGELLRWQQTPLRDTPGKRPASLTHA